MIRQATEQDIPDIVKLGSQSLIDGPYKGIIKDTPEKSAETAMQVIKAAGGKVLLYEDDDTHEVNGMLAFIIYPQIFTGEMTANEIVWYLKPDARKGGGAIKLLWEAEKLAKEMGAIYMAFTAPTSEVAALYKRWGYAQVEVSFMKKLRHN